MFSVPTLAYMKVMPRNMAPAYATGWAWMCRRATRSLTAPFSKGLPSVDPAGRTHFVRQILAHVLHRFVVAPCDEEGRVPVQQRFALHRGQRECAKLLLIAVEPGRDREHERDHEGGAKGKTAPPRPGAATQRGGKEQHGQVLRRRPDPGGEADDESGSDGPAVLRRAHAKQEQRHRRQEQQGEQAVGEQTRRGEQGRRVQRQQQRCRSRHNRGEQTDAQHVGERNRQCVHQCLHGQDDPRLSAGQCVDGRDEAGIAGRAVGVEA